MDQRLTPKKQNPMDELFSKKDKFIISVCAVLWFSVWAIFVRSINPIIIVALIWLAVWLFGVMMELLDKYLCKKHRGNDEKV